MAQKSGVNGSVAIPKDRAEQEAWLSERAKQLMAKGESCVGAGHVLICREEMDDHKPLTAKGGDAMEAIIDRLRAFYHIPALQLPRPGLQLAVPS